MRRTFSIFLILQFWLGPLVVLLPASEESRLPACCRRHGAHHCAMSSEMASGQRELSSGSAPVFAVPAHCSSFPDLFVASTEPIQALAASPAQFPSPRAKTISPVAIRSSTLLGGLYTRSNRGPPTSDFV
jgi:hypothetical protein